MQDLLWVVRKADVCVCVSEAECDLIKKDYRNGKGKRGKERKDRNPTLKRDQQMSQKGKSSLAERLQAHV